MARYSYFTNCYSSSTYFTIEKLFWFCNQTKPLINTGSHSRLRKNGTKQQLCFSNPFCSSSINYSQWNVMNLYSGDYLNRAFVDILRNLITLDEIIKSKYQVRIITRFYPHSKYLLTEESFIKLLTNNMLMIQAVLDSFLLQNSRHHCLWSLKREKV